MFGLSALTGLSDIEPVEENNLTRSILQVGIISHVVSLTLDGSNRSIVSILAICILPVSIQCIVGEYTLVQIDSLLGQLLIQLSLVPSISIGINQNLSLLSIRSLSELLTFNNILVDQLVPVSICILIAISIIGVLIVSTNLTTTLRSDGVLTSADTSNLIGLRSEVVQTSLILLIQSSCTIVELGQHRNISEQGVRDEAIPVVILNGLIVTRSLDINEVAAPTIVSTSVVVEPEVINLLGVLSSQSITSDSHSQLNPDVWIRSIVLILGVSKLIISEVCISLGEGLSLEADPT